MPHSLRCLLAAVLGLCTAGISVQAADTPWKPRKAVEIVIGAQAGGANDRVGRVLQKILADTNAVPVPTMVMNKPGQGQSLSVAYVNTHPADPHYLVVLGSSWVTTAITTGSNSTHRDLTPIIKAFDGDLVMFVAGGHVSAGISSSGSAQAMSSLGKVRMIGTISNQRLPLLPDLPTLREQGYDVVASTWFTVFGPRGITPAQAAYWEDVFSKAMRHPEAKKFAETNNWTIDLIGSKELPAQLDKEYARLRKALTELGMVQ